MASKIIAYNVYRAPEGSGESFLGRVDTLEAAYALVGGPELPEHLYDTARAAGHVGGLAAPEKAAESEDGPSEWFGPRSEYCAVPVLAKTA